MILAISASWLAAAPEQARYVGAVTCQSSFCHGGAAPLARQYTIWYHCDAHARAYDDLVSGFGVQIAKVAGLSSSTDASCVVCHAPMAESGRDLAPTASPTEGVSCEACHNAAGSWLRSHTRPDYTHADRIRAGMADLGSAMARADRCVTCHAALDPKLIRAGHPPLVFELDGQITGEPRHWREKSSWFGAKAWLVGQAVALREIAKAASTVKPDDLPPLTAQQRAIRWLLLKVPDLPKTAASSDDTQLQTWGDALAVAASKSEWNEPAPTLAVLAGTADSFKDANVPALERAARSQVLALALDRMLKATHPTAPIDPLKPLPPLAPLPGEMELGEVFQLAGNPYDPQTFDANKFAEALHKFAAVVAPSK
jgi:hypothetical protein